MSIQTEELAEFFKNHVAWATANKRAYEVCELTALSFLIDHQIATVEEIAERIGQVQSVLPEKHRDEVVTERLDFLVHVLRVVYERPTQRWTPEVIQGGLDDPEDHSQNDQPPDNS